MSLWIKICGMSGPAGVAAAVDAGADALGFVFHPPSPRALTPARAAALARGVPPGVERVAVMLHPVPAYWLEVWQGFRPDRLQTDAADFDALTVDPACAQLPVYRDARLHADGDPGAWPPLVLYEGARSGAGQRPDWALAARVARRTRLVLAGGLDPDNVADAVRQVRPFGVDVSSGVEAAPGRNDPGRIRAFIAAARAAEYDDDD